MQRKTIAGTVLAVSTMLLLGCVGITGKNVGEVSLAFGVVIDESTKKPIPNKIVRIYLWLQSFPMATRGLIAEVVTNEEGYFEYKTQIDGEYEFEVGGIKDRPWGFERVTITSKKGIQIEVKILAYQGAASNGLQAPRLSSLDKKTTPSQTQPAPEPH